MKVKRAAVRSEWPSVCARRPVRRLALTAAFAIVALLTVPGARGQAITPEQLKVNVLQGENDVHRPGDKTGTSIRIAVLNEVDLPQPEAECSFSVDADGPGVRLEKDTASLNLKRTSGADGQVLVDGLFGNKINGPVVIRVSCSFEGKEGRAIINQVNERGSIFTRNRLIVIAGAMAAAGISLYEVYKPGPPSAAINAPTASSGTPQVTFRVARPRFGR